MKRKKTTKTQLIRQILITGIVDKLSMVNILSIFYHYKKI